MDQKRGREGRAARERRLARPGGLLGPCEPPASYWSSRCWARLSRKLPGNRQAGCDLTAPALPTGPRPFQP